MDNSSLAHTIWTCKYHIVFAPKYREEDASPEIRELKREVESKKAVLQKRRAQFPKL